MAEKEKQTVVLKNKISEYKEKLTELIKDANQVYITAHKNPDYDAIASLGAMALICKKLKKAPYIVLDKDDYEELNDEEAKMLEKIKEKFVVINMDDYESNKVDNSLLITVDVNKTFMTAFKNKYKDFKNILIVDHHKEDEDTIKTKNKLILDDLASSCSEILYYLLQQYRITPSDVDYYTFLLAGIYLDTNQCAKNMFPSTHECISELIEKGAEKMKVERIFAPDFESDRRVQRLVDDTKWLTLRFAIGIGNEEEYTKEEVAQAADYALKYVCEAAIYLGKDKDGKYNVSARSNRGNVDIAYLMHELNNGGGNDVSASCPAIYVDADSKEEEKNILFDKIKKIIYYKSKKEDKE